MGGGRRSEEALKMHGLNQHICWYITNLKTNENTIKDAYNSTKLTGYHDFNTR